MQIGIRFGLLKTFEVTGPFTPAHGQFWVIRCCMNSSRMETVKANLPRVGRSTSLGGLKDDDHAELMRRHRRARPPCSRPD